MKTVIAIALFLIFSSLNFLVEFIADEKVIPSVNAVESVKQKSGSVKQEESISNYNINVKFDKLHNMIFVSGTLNWINKNDTSLQVIYINIPNDNGNLKYDIKLNKLFGQFNYEIVNAESDLFIDSTLVKLNLQDDLQPGDTLNINFNFSITENESNRRGENLFLQLENWYPKVAVYSSGKFQAHPQHKYIKSFSEFSDYTVSITIPDKCQIAVPNVSEVIEKNGEKVFRCSIKTITSFDWVLFNNYIESSFELKLAEQKILLRTFTQKGNDGYIDRYRQAVKRLLNNLSGKFDYPYNCLTIVELPQNEDLLGKAYPTILAVKPKIISPVGSQNLEYGVASLLVEQFLGNIVAPNNNLYAWLSKGVSAYIAEKLVQKIYGEHYSYFRLARYYPIKGMHFLSFSEIPLIYTLGDEVIPEGGRFINDYYKNIIYSDCSIPSSYFPNYRLYRTTSVVKPQLALLTLERFLGYEKIFNNLSKYYNRYKYQHPTSDQFLQTITEGCNKKSERFINDLFQTGKRFDYAIKYLKKISENKYEILAERRESGIAPIEIKIYTNKDIIKLNWDGKANFKRFVFDSYDEVIAAEIDPQRKNILDLNFANNSYIVENQYWGSFSLSTRIFFWIQNALLLIGGIG